MSAKQQAYPEHTQEWSHRLLTGVGELEALVRVRRVAVEFQPQVVRGAVQGQAQELAFREGPQGPRRRVFPIIYLRRGHRRAPLRQWFYISRFNKMFTSSKMRFCEQ